MILFVQVQISYFIAEHIVGLVHILGHQAFAHPLLILSMIDALLTSGITEEIVLITE